MTEITNDFKYRNGYDAASAASHISCALYVAETQHYQCVNSQQSNTTEVQQHHTEL